MSLLMNRLKDIKGTVRLPGGTNATWEQVCDGNGTSVLKLSLPYAGAYGMGEKYNGINQKGRNVVNQVEEKFCYQGEKTYCPAPFFFTDTGLGIYIATDMVTSFDFTKENRISVTMPADAKIYMSTGTPAELIGRYMAMHGTAKLPPKWAFGPWISANHWNTQQQVELQREKLRQYDYPATVLVVEAWSDEATFYIFNGARYEARPDGGALRYEDFDFSQSSYWQDPKAMIERLHGDGLHFVLWQIPVYKKQDPEEILCIQNELDKADAKKRGLCVKNTNGTPYVIPEGHWFPGSMIPDFTNPKTRRTWFAKRQYLLDIGVDGFKTDGGEFIYTDHVRFNDGATGRQGKNRYPQSYTRAYTEFLGDDHILFSRAGYAGQHTTPCHWGGDQQSTNAELNHVLKAGLSAALTGIPFWGFDIAGFAGPLPTLDLYRRATMLGCFCPIMQWHSEPDGGQFKELMPGGEGNNERSPWNLAAAYDQPAFIDEMRFWHKLRMNLVPYLYAQALFSAEFNMPMMRPLVYDWPKDPHAVATEDIFMLGDSLLIAPLMEEDQTVRQVYLPAGDWYALFTAEKVLAGADVSEGECGTVSCGRYISSDEKERFPVYLRGGCGIGLNVPKGAPLGAGVGNDVNSYAGLRLLLAGERGSMDFRDEQGNDFTVRWKDGKYNIEGTCLLEPEVVWWK